MAQSFDDLDVAVVSVAGRFPGARNVADFWRNLRQGVESIRTLTDDELRAAHVDERLLTDPSYVRRASTLDDVEFFDAGLFGYSPREAAQMDPQCRLFLECAWEALESAGYNPTEPGMSVGVFAGQSLSTYLLGHLHPDLTWHEFTLAGRNLHAILGNGSDFLTTRVSYKFNLTGPSVNVQTACSSSLVAVHMARQALLSGECEMALAGAASIYLPQAAGYRFQEGMILSPDGRCRPFDAEAQGTVFGRGVGVVVLKLLSAARRDGDPIRAVIKGSAINNDGAAKVAFTAPAVDGQARVIAEALANAGVESETISYVEAHGTGTPRGDPIEIAALTRAFGSAPRASRCAIGSVKGNVGHLDVAAGMAGLIKTVLMLEQRELVPTLHFRQPNPQIDFDRSPFDVNASLRPWPEGAGPRRAGVSAFGMGGTNAHLILEEAPEVGRKTPEGERPLHVFTLSAKSDAALTDLVTATAAWCREQPHADIADACYTTNVGRAHFPHRVAIGVRSSAEAAAALDRLRAAEARNPATASVGRPHVAFLFTGQGAQYSGMGRRLYGTEPVFRAALDRCADLLRPELDRPLLSIMFDQAHAAALDQTQYTQPALFALEYALVELWRSWGIVPDRVMGHSLGEDIAACVAGVFSLEDGLRLIAARARLMQALPPDGEMVSVFGPEARVRRAVRSFADTTAIAALNAPDNLVISGERTAIRRIVAELSGEGIKSVPLTASHAFHSPLMDPMLDEFERVARGIAYSEPSIPLISNVTAATATPRLLTDPAYWRRHVREPVRFTEAITELCAQGITHLIEIGPTPTLIALGRRSVVDDGVAWLPSLRKGRDDGEQVVETLAALYAAGVDPRWSEFHRGRERRRVGLPTYPFRRERHWIAPAAERHAATPVGSPAARLVGKRLVSPALNDTVFETFISLATVPFADDHRVAGTRIFPATGFLELALEAVEGTVDKPVDLEHVTIDRALPIGDGSTTVQTIVAAAGDGRVQVSIFSRDGNADHGCEWTRHATAEAVTRVAARGADHAEVGVGAARDRCSSQSSGGEYYARLHAAGFGYGPRFQGIQEIWWRSREAVARIARPDFDESHDYVADPPWLDAALQSVLGAVGQLDGGADLYLPVAIAHVSIFGPLAAAEWSHAEVRDGGAGEMLADVRLFDASEKPVAVLRGVRLTRVGRAAFERQHLAGARDPLFEIAWEPAPLSTSQDAGAAAEFLAPMPALLDHVVPALDGIRARFNLAQDHTLLPELDRLCADYAIDALRALGWDPRAGELISTGDLSARLAVKVQLVPMLKRMLDMLTEDGFLARESESWRVRRPFGQTSPAERMARLSLAYPACRAELTLTQRCGEQLAAVLGGGLDPLQLLFPDGSSADLEQLYREAPFTRAYNTVVREAVVRALAQLPDDRVVRILEIGAGTGGTSAHVLPALRPDRTEYVFTDASNLFMTRAREKFRAFPFVRYQVLDIDWDPAAQGFDAPRYDIVLATNVLHATADLRRTMEYVRGLLVPGGLLLVVEGISRQRWVDVLFGLTDGWWKSTDADLRQGYPLIGRREWRTLLEAVGFRDAVCIPEESRAPICEQAVMLARAPVHHEHAARRPGPAAEWIVVGDALGFAGQVAERLATHGTVRIVMPADRFASQADGTILVDPTRPADFLRALDTLTVGTACRAVVHCVAAGVDGSDSLDAMRLRQARHCGSLLHLAQAMTQKGVGSPLRVVTQGAQAVAQQDATMPEDATLWGLARVIALEHPELSCTCIDLDPSEPSDASAAHVVDELTSADANDQIAWRRGIRHVARLIPSAVGTNGARALDGEPPSVALQIRRPGTFDGLEAHPVARRKPGAGEIEIRVHTSGLNFKDVLSSLGTYPGDPGPLGLECAGRVTAVGDAVEGVRPGDEVIAIAPGSLGTHVVTWSALVAPKPAALTYEQAATVPAAFLTAYYGLHVLAGVRRGDRVLIHAAAGGVGLAAVQLARRAGAEVFATVSTEEKRAVAQQYGAVHVMDSRTPAFADEILRVTGGRGVDVVLNSLAGENLDRSFTAIARGGRFIELGKNGIWSSERVGALGREIAYHVVDVQADAQRDPKTFGGYLREVVHMIDAKDIAPLPVTSFSFESANQAFRFMAQAKHIGKIAIAAPRRRHAPLTVRPDASYLITGGFGGLGLLFANWMADHGARHIALMGRQASRDAAEPALAALRSRDVRVHVFVGDVSDPVAVAGTIGAIRQQMPPLGGVLHAAGRLDDGALSQQTWERFDRVMRAKVDGAWNLDRATRGMDLDWFVLFSSLASVVGSRGQANHAAANAYMDALAAHRRQRGYPGSSINWGPWAQVGAAAQGDYLDRLAASGIRAIAPDDGLRMFETIVRASGDAATRAQIGVLPIDWRTYTQRVCGGHAPALLSKVNVAEQPDAPRRDAARPTRSATPLIERVRAARKGERRAIVVGYVREHVGRSLGLEEVPIDVRQPLSELGLDSLMAIELRGRIGAGLGVARSLPATLLFDYPSIAQIAEFLERGLVSSESEAPAEAVPAGSVVPMAAMAAIAELTDEEAERLLLAELTPRPEAD